MSITWSKLTRQLEMWQDDTVADERSGRTERAKTYHLIDLELPGGDWMRVTERDCITSNSA
jgi:hypothetical protein